MTFPLAYQQSLEECPASQGHRAHQQRQADPSDQHTGRFHRLAVLIDRVAVHTQSCRYRGFGQIADAFDFIQRSGYLGQDPA